MKKQTKSIRWDVILIAAVAAVGAVIALVLFIGRQSGGTVQVRVDGEITQEFSLQEDRIFEIKGVNGGTNLLVIENGTARITQASCPDGLCMHMGAIDSAGQSIVCLPNRVVVEIVAGDGEDTPAVDVTVG